MVNTTCQKCGINFMVKPYYLKIGRGKYCSRGCSNLAHIGEGNPAYKHGNSCRTGQTKEYRTWAEVKKRVVHGNPLNRRYYLEKGITMCERWFESFDSFLEDMGTAPSNDHQIDRIDNNGNYEPSNCRWVTRTEQMNNVHTNVSITFNGKTMNQEEWGRETGLSGGIIAKRLRRGWSVEDTLTKPRMVFRSGRWY